ncbi:hypothetical protein Glove_88g49 [Diversispora epigaea]|uniref:DUF659 domain-containing protein n=1 Tax=Diversispora epigaea TaxID=1348612 RepID=A0A397J5Y9_9GLOM|nr:hypothetical protein Glove_88g49 [Diversispora epigaea]
MIDSEDELLISISNRKRPGCPKNEVWQHFNTIPADSKNGKKDLHSGQHANFANKNAHLTLQCPKPPPPEVRALYLEILNNGSFDDNDDDNFSKRSKPYKQSKITNHQRRCSRALTKFFVTCGVPLWIVENLFFIDYSKELCPGFQVPKRTILSTTIINVETATVIAEMKKKLSNETNLTLGLDGWTSSAGQSLYIFLIMTSDGKEYIHSLKNFSKNSHTEEFLKNEIIKVIEEVGAEKFCSIVSDHASNVVLAKNLVSTKYPHIFSIRCIVYHINLLSKIVKNMIKGELCPGFQVPKRTILSTTIINVETATVIAEMKKKLSNETNLTLGLDGWTSSAGQSLYIFLIMTSDGKEYIHSLKNFSKNSHTEEFLKNEIIKVIEEVGAEKFCSIVSDHASNVVLAKNLVSTKYPHIFSIRCGGLKKYIITRWTIAYDCTDSIIRCKNALKQILENELQLLNLEIISILRKQNFFRNVKDLRTILLPIKKAIINFEHKSTTLADCFINLVIMATAIKELSQTSNQNFSKECQNVFDKR